MYLRSQQGGLGLAQVGPVGRVWVYLSNPDVRAFTFPFASPGISGLRGCVWFTAQLVAASAQTENNCFLFTFGQVKTPG